MSKIKIILTALSTLLVVSSCASTKEDTLKSIVTTLNLLTQEVKKAAGRINSLEGKWKTENQALETVGRQLIAQEAAVEEKIRSEGQSGIKSVRNTRQGTSPYYGTQYAGRHGIIDIHDHAEYDRTLGLGELVVVMNGVEFRTRHNDYKFKMKSDNRVDSQVVDIPFPDVPKEVTDKPTVEEQGKELKEWFRAFKEQDYSVRDYRKYFKANMCYLEGAWTLASEKIDEPFKSDRHQIDAKSWFELQKKIRYSSYGGSKSSFENFAFLPTTMYNSTDGKPQIAQWNYQILCHPLSEDLPLKHIKMVDSLATRLSKGYLYQQRSNRQNDRYKINKFDNDRQTRYSLLDKIMYEIPGKDNYGNNITDEAFGSERLSLETPNKDSILKAGYYSRIDKIRLKGVKGFNIDHRGFRDQNLFVALTTQPKIMPLSTKICSGNNCQHNTLRVSYAIPLEIVYSTPMQSWNPYNIDYVSKYTAIKGGRNGKTEAMAFNGSSSNHYYRTPEDFYYDGHAKKVSMHVLNRDGNVHKVVRSGFSTISFTFDWKISKLRLRYPVFHGHLDASTVGQEVKALTEMVSQMSEHADLYKEKPMTKPSDQDDVVLTVPNAYKPDFHGHEIRLTAVEYKSLMAGNPVTSFTTTSVGHRHEMTLHFNEDKNVIFYDQCDGQLPCSDGHPLTIVHQKFFNQSSNQGDKNSDAKVVFHTSSSVQNPPGAHDHVITLTTDEYKSVMAGKSVQAITTISLGHQHQMLISYNKKLKYFYYSKCDGHAKCPDGHRARITKQD